MTFKGECKELGKFYRKNFWMILISLCLALIAFGFMLTHYSLTIDEETWANNAGNSLSWLKEGRFGIYLLDCIFSPNGSYIPYLWDWISVILWSLSAPIILYSIISYFPSYRPFNVLIFCTYFSTIPLCVGEILSYSMFNLQISIAMFCTVISCWLSGLYQKSGRKRLLLISVILLVFAISVYQAFLCVYITWAFSCVLIEVLQGKLIKKKVLHNLLSYAGVFVVSAAVYGGINLFISHYIIASGNHLTESYVGWGNGNLFVTIFLALANVIRVSFGITVLGQNVYGGIAICVTTILFCAAMIYAIIKANGKKQKWYLFFITACFVISPFSLYIALGTYKTPGRMLIAISLTGAIQWLILLTFFSEKKKVHHALIALSLIVLIYNVFAMNRLFYDSWRVYQYDKDTAAQIMSEIEQKGYSYKNKPVAFIGMYDDHAGIPLIRSDSCGGSFFNWDDGDNSRFTNFFHAEGYPIIRPTPAQISSALKSSRNMPLWPNPSGIVETQECIVVHLSDPTPKWYQINQVDAPTA